jgi:hypothetical protein
MAASRLLEGRAIAGAGSLAGLASSGIMSATWTQRAIEKPGVLEWMAWRRYLTATRASSSVEYPIIEEAAWERLREDFARVGSPFRPGRSFVSETAAARTPAGSRG